MEIHQKALQVSGGRLVVEVCVRVYKQISYSKAHIKYAGCCEAGSSASASVSATNIYLGGVTGVTHGGLAVDGGGLACL